MKSSLSDSEDLRYGSGYLKILKTGDLYKNLKDWWKCKNSKLALAECTKSMLQILVSFD